MRCWQRCVWERPADVVRLDSLGWLQVCLTLAQFFRNVFCEAKDSTWYFSSPRVLTQFPKASLSFWCWDRGQEVASLMRGGQVGLRLLWSLQAPCRSTAAVPWTSELGQSTQPRAKSCSGCGRLAPGKEAGKSGPVSGHWVTTGEHRKFGARLSPPGAASLASGPMLTTARPLWRPGLTHGPSLCSCTPLLC